MKVGLLGSGMVGRTLAAGFASRGHDVTIGSRSPDKAELRAWLEEVGKGVKVGTFEDAARNGETLVLCCLGSAVPEVIRSAGESNFDGKVLIDVTNPLDFSHGMPPSLTIGVTDSLGEVIQRTLPRAEVVKCFNIVPSSRMTNPRGADGTKPDMLMCGNNQSAKQKVRGILLELGWDEPIDIGGIEGSRWLEAYVPLWVRVAVSLGDYNAAARFVR